MATDLSSSDEEVRRKPEAAMPRELPNEPITASETGHFDILVIGRTGMGKSSTVDKLMVPNTEETSQAQNSTVLTDKQPIDFSPRASSSDKIKIPGSGAQAQKSKKPKKLEGDEHRTNIQSGNLSAWVLSDKEDELENTVTRLKNIVFCRDLEESHEQIDTLRKDKESQKSFYASSRSCELLINDDSNIRVLDTPGFFSPSLFEGASNEDASNLAIVRRIVYIQTVAGLRFNRILYFLPCGPLKRDEGTILKEVRCMVKFFDKSIFLSMVLVGTIPSNLSKKSHLTEEDKFPEDDLEESRECFYKTVKKAYEERNEDITDLPTPPMIFVAMTDTCEKILRKVVSAPVKVGSGLQLRFQRKTCTRCAIKIGYKEGEKLVCTYSSTNESTTVPYEDSTCHPKIVPKITVRSFFRGLGGLFLRKWHFTEERCINPDCKQGPGSLGCKQVQSKYAAKGCKDSIIVDHTDTLDDCTIEASASEGHDTVQ